MSCYSGWEWGRIEPTQVLSRGAEGTVIFLSILCICVGKCCTSTGTESVQIEVALPTLVQFGQRDMACTTELFCTTVIHNLGIDVMIDVMGAVFVSSKLCERCTDLK